MIYQPKYQKTRTLEEAISDANIPRARIVKNTIKTLTTSISAGYESVGLIITNEKYCCNDTIIAPKNTPIKALTAEIIVPCKKKTCFICRWFSPKA